MLATDHDKVKNLSFPVMASPKLDGVRGLKHEGKGLARSLKPIPNDYIRHWVEDNLPNGVDGEIVAGSFCDSTSAVNSVAGEPDFVFHAFDSFTHPNLPYYERLKFLDCIAADKHFEVVPVTWIYGEEDLAAYEAAILEQGHEGVIIRPPESVYKFGRSKDLIRIKRFVDSEAVVVGFKEKFKNGNPQERNELGYAKRSSSKAGKLPTGELGALILDYNGIEFSLTFNHIKANMSAKDAWENRDKLLGRLVKFKHQAAGAKTAPRIPTMLGFREDWDK